MEIVIKNLKRVFVLMKSIHGPKVIFLGINMDFRNNERVMLEMSDYLRKIMNYFTGKIKRKPTLAGNNLFDIEN